MVKIEKKDGKGDREGRRKPPLRRKRKSRRISKPLILLESMFSLNIDKTKP